MCLLRRLTTALNVVDRIYFAWFLSLTIAIVLLRHRVEHWPWYIAIHVVLLAVIGWLALGEFRLRRFLHDWYPLAIFIVCFEEVARLSFLFVEGWRDHYILAFEAYIFPVPPTVWLQQFDHPLVTELLEIGYFGFYALPMIVGGVLYPGQDKQRFRQFILASVLTYVVCYVVFLAFPTESPARTLRHLHTVEFRGGPFHWAVLLIQKHGGVHGNAFPSSHVAAAVVALCFAWRYQRKLGVWVTPIVILLCIGAVYDRYHYASDIAAGLLIGAAVSAAVLRYVPIRAATCCQELQANNL